MPLDLTATANANSPAVRANADVLVAGDSSGQLGIFRDFARSSKMSTNVSADKVIRFDGADGLLHGRALAILQAGGSTSIGLANFAAKTWAPRREAFEDLWVDGRTALYGALNAGSMGAEGGFGDFCLIIEAPDSGASGLGVFPADSAQRYTDDFATVDAARAAVEVCGWSERGSLTTVERATDVNLGDSSTWPPTVSRPDHYLEVVRTGDAPLGLVTEVRIRRAKQAELEDLRAARLRGEAIDATDIYSLAAYDVIQGWRRMLGVTVATV